MVWIQECEPLPPPRSSLPLFGPSVLPEPLPVDHPLWKQKNAVITPHVSGGFHLEETHERIIRIMAENLAAYCAGRPLRNVVDFETGYRKL